MTHVLRKIDVLEYALEGAIARRGIHLGYMTAGEEELLDDDIKEIKRRIKLTELAHARVEAQPSSQNKSK